MLSPAGSGSLDQPDRLQVVRPVVSTVAATAGDADRQETREKPNMKDRKLCLFIAISKRPFGFRDPLSAPSVRCSTRPATFVLVLSIEGLRSSPSPSSPRAPAAPNLK